MASLRFAFGDDPVYVAEQLGRTDPTFSMRVYAKAIRRGAATIRCKPSAS